MEPFKGNSCTNKRIQSEPTYLDFEHCKYLLNVYDDRTIEHSNSVEHQISEGGKVQPAAWKISLL